MSTVDPTVKTSRVFEALRKLHAALDAAAFPAAPGGALPQLCFHSVPIDRHGEFVAILVNDEESTADWIQTGPAAKEERFTLDVVIHSNLRAQFDGLAVIERLEQIADVVQGVLWDATNNKPKALGFQNERIVGRWTGVAPTLYELDTGIVGEAVVRIGLVAHV